MSLAVSDTHALIWWTLGPTRKLGRQARAAFSTAEQRRTSIYIPVLCLVEISEAVHAGKVHTDIPLAQWIDRLLAPGHFVAADLTTDIVREAESLYAVPERSDRLIAATALHLDCPLISRDPAMARIPGLTTIW